ncbi:ubiquitin-like small modifier protein 1 [Caldinitratiruptor microaerophilus]|uniref:Molybdopterin synthase sulfur carrier subunit n=1 Tax=Caldinitratiruptor microaerophilus TaxID=671077 RepID=A0AA35G731_9FIRM|nr:ubiquitin-like small modifier protein 1 [Caldinitratiruptor microaerophilus]BDG59646.1 molybdopterin synthase sulfur carrier subunit [Caldinitratiruptor microaerophilus]
MEVRLYASLRDVAGTRVVTVPAKPGETVGEVLGRVFARHPALRPLVLSPDGSGLLPHVLVFLSGRSIRELQGLDTPVGEDDELALFPPVGGGRG